VAIGSITQSGTTAVLYNVTSDQRLKENIQNADDAASLIDALQVRKFDWKADGNHQRYGFVAQELVSVTPEAVHQPADPEEVTAGGLLQTGSNARQRNPSLRVRDCPTGGQMTTFNWNLPNSTATRKQRGKLM
jgi:hypothetical protein